MTDRTKDAAYVAFVEAAWQRHLGLAVLLTGDRWQAEELLQDTLVKIYERWRRLARTDDLHAYLRKALVNGYTSLWRRRRRESLVADVPERAAPPGRGHAEVLVLRDALRTLPPRQRAVVVLRHYVAMANSCAASCPKSRCRRAIHGGKPTAARLCVPDSGKELDHLLLDTRRIYDWLISSSSNLDSLGTFTETILVASLTIRQIVSARFLATREAILASYMAAASWMIVDKHQPSMGT